MVAPASPVALAQVRVPIAPLLAEPLVSSGQTSQLLAGHPVDVLETRGEWLRVCGEDEYEGWMHRGYLTMVNRDAWREERHAAHLVREPRLSLGCIVAGAGGRRALPLGAWLDADERVLEGEAIPFRERDARFPVADGAAICRTAETFFRGTSYQWGGITPWGADCSGLVQTTFGLHGVELHRDAWQQAQQGEPAGGMLSLPVGALLFFSDRSDGWVTHVGISCGGRRMMHLALGRGGWSVERLDDEVDPYVALLRERFLFARIVLGD
jgi:gamma-D-glutamyl-L-lysine dipeptidyl-peptidase